MSEPLLGVEKLALLDQPYEMMQAFCAQEELTCLDLLPVLKEYAGEQLYFTTDMHLNARGNAILAETLAGWIEEHPEVFEGEQ
jgi:lysophospholipase L1-like esterase